MDATSPAAATVLPARASSQPFRMFSAEVRCTRRLSPGFVRLTFTGPDLDAMADNGYDQRIKLILPLPDLGLSTLPTGDDWYSAWRRLPEVARNPVRTYTVRNVRRQAREVDVDMVLHGGEHGHVGGPAARFAERARPGDEVVLLGPDVAYPGRHGGLEFRPPSPSVPLLLAADETGVPAVANIARALPRDARGQVLLEVPHPDDRFDLGAPDGVRVSWVTRGGAGHGAHLLRTVRTAPLPQPSRTAPAGSVGTPGDPSDGPLWDVPETSTGGTGLYAWVAGEAATVRAIRRHLVNDLGHDRRSVAFMGYWRMGRPEC